MAPNPRRIDERLQAIYDKLPSIDCQGLCYDSCGPIDLSRREKVKIEKAAGHTLGVNGITCNMLVDGRCSVYELRPMICRAWGVVEGMPCPYGCKPDPAPMPDAEFAFLIAESLKIGGGLTHADEELYRLIGEAREEDPENFERMLGEMFKRLGVRPTLQGRGERLPFGVGRRPSG